jgi:predicted RND superfamily exporter protein
MTDIMMLQALLTQEAREGNEEAKKVLVELTESVYDAHKVLGQLKENARTREEHVANVVSIVYMTEEEARKLVEEKLKEMLAEAEAEKAWEGLNVN